MGSALRKEVIGIVERGSDEIAFIGIDDDCSLRENRQGGINEDEQNDLHGPLQCVW